MLPIHVRADILTRMPTFERQVRPFSACQSAAWGVCPLHGAAPTSPWQGSSCYFPYRDAHPRRSSGGGTPKRWMRSRIAANNSRGAATSAIWKITYLRMPNRFGPPRTPHLGNPGLISIQRPHFKLLISGVLSRYTCRMWNHTSGTAIVEPRRVSVRRWYLAGGLGRRVGRTRDNGVP